MYVADMYIKVTQYDKMQRAFVGDSPQLRSKVRFVSKFLLFGLLINSSCIFV